HMGARLVPMRVEAPALTVPTLTGSAKLPGLSGSASIRERRLTVTLTNPSLEAEVPAVIRLEGGGRVAEGRGTVLTHDDMTATNTFANPDNVTPKALAVRTSADAASVTIPKRAVVAVELEIAWGPERRRGRTRRIVTDSTRSGTSRASAPNASAATGSRSSGATPLAGAA